MPSNTNQTNKRKILVLEDATYTDAAANTAATNTNTTTNSVLAEISSNVRRTRGSTKKQRLPEPEAVAEVVSDDEDDEDYVDLGDVVAAQDDDAPEVVVFDQPVIDENGLIQVGPQPVKAHKHDVRSLPESEIMSKLRRCTRKCLARDSKLPDADSDTETERREKLQQDLLTTLIKNGNNYFSRVCDYTGNDLLWTPGPKSMSIEATYSFVSHGEILLYHAAPNVILTMWILNIVKKHHPIIVLPLLAVILNADLKTQQSHVAWTFMPCATPPAYNC